MTNGPPPRWRAVIFDLDGTLADTLATIAHVANLALESLGLPPHPVDAYRTMVGDGIVKLCERALPPGAEHRHEEMLARTREYYARHRTEGARLYPGILDVLQELRRRSVRLAVLSNKLDDLTHGTLHDLGVHHLFAAILGQRDRAPPKPDPAGAEWLLERLAVPRETVLYVGDTGTDMRTAGAAGLIPVGALWGFRSAEELRLSGARHLVREPREILDLFEGEHAS
jgi:phosphoglycolate phosphatase